MPSENKFVVLSPHCTLKHLEELHLYDVRNDELYELSSDAYRFLLGTCQGENPPVREEDKEFIQFCFDENLIHHSETPIHRKMIDHPSPDPSLRYLELQITGRCNLRCRHCYLGEAQSQDLALDRIQKVLEEFEEIQGLRLLISGGEPLLHPGFWEMNERLPDFAFRSVLLSNGTLITPETARRLHVHEVQVSLDGMEEGHESIRGRGTFEKALRAIGSLQEAGTRVSVATMIHRTNLEEFDRLRDFLESRQIKEWNVDVPCIEGKFRENQDLWVSPEEAGPYLGYGFGGGWHDSKKNLTCGAHLCAILVDGGVCKCGLFSREVAGTIEDGLRLCWGRIPRIPLEALRCRCQEIEACKGGCRYRASTRGDVLDPDPFQCFARGVLKGGEKDEY
jgi:MoaA/NifB/PqqE/SkfB family radical SAM enzyme